MTTPDLGPPPSPVPDLAPIVDPIIEKLPDLKPNPVPDVKKSIFKNPMLWVGISAIIIFVILSRKKKKEIVLETKEIKKKEIKNEYPKRAIDWSRAKGYNDNINTFGVNFPPKRR